MLHFMVTAAIQLYDLKVFYAAFNIGQANMRQMNYHGIARVKVLFLCELNFLIQKKFDANPFSCCYTLHIQPKGASDHENLASDMYDCYCNIGLGR